MPNQRCNSSVVVVSLSWQCRSQHRVYGVFWRIHTETENTNILTVQNFYKLQS